MSGIISRLMKYAEIATRLMVGENAIKNHQEMLAKTVDIPVGEFHWLPEDKQYFYLSNVYDCIGVLVTATLPDGATKIGMSHFNAHDNVNGVENLKAALDELLDKTPTATIVAHRFCRETILTQVGENGHARFVRSKQVLSDISQQYKFRTNTNGENQYEVPEHSIIDSKTYNITDLGSFMSLVTQIAAGTDWAKEQSSTPYAERSDNGIPQAKQNETSPTVYVSHEVCNKQPATTSQNRASWVEKTGNQPSHEHKKDSTAGTSKGR
jgi:hypothetical protein